VKKILVLILVLLSTAGSSFSMENKRLVKHLKNLESFEIVTKKYGITIENGPDGIRKVSITEKLLQNYKEGIKLLKTIKKPAHVIFYADPFSTEQVEEILEATEEIKSLVFWGTEESKEKRAWKESDAIIDLFEKHKLTWERKNLFFHTFEQITKNKI
jgi:hypothetical protein